MSLTTNLAFTTVMDLRIIDRAFTVGKTYSFLQADDGGFHYLPFIDQATSTVNATKLSGNIDGAAAVVTAVDGAIVMTISTTDIVTFDLGTGIITLSGSNAASIVNFDFTIDSFTSAEILTQIKLATGYIKPVGTLECLTISNITQEGPRKEIRAGKAAQPCVRYGKTMRLEVEDAVFSLATLGTIGGATVLDDLNSVSVTDVFPESFMLVGDTSVVDKDNGGMQDVWLTFFDFLPDGVFDITMESEGDIGVMAIAGELFPETAATNRYWILEEKV